MRHVACPACVTRFHLLAGPLGQIHQRFPVRPFQATLVFLDEHLCVGRDQPVYGLVNPVVGFDSPVGVKWLVSGYGGSLGGHLHHQLVWA